MGFNNKASSSKHRLISECSCCQSSKMFSRVMKLQYKPIDPLLRKCMYEKHRHECRFHVNIPVAIVKNTHYKASRPEYRMKRYRNKILPKGGWWHKQALVGVRCASQEWRIVVVATVHVAAARSGLETMTCNWVHVFLLCEVWVSLGVVVVT